MLVVIIYMAKVINTLGSSGRRSGWYLELACYVAKMDGILTEEGQI